MFKSLAVAVVAGAVLLAGWGSVAQADPPKREGGRAAWREHFQKSPLGKLITGWIGRAMVLRSELDVTDDQKRQIHSILKEHRRDILTAVRPVVENRQKLQDAVLDESFDEEAIRDAADELGKSIGDAAVTFAKVAGKLRGVMTEEQREKIEKFREANREAVDKFFDTALEDKDKD